MNPVLDTAIRIVFWYTCAAVCTILNKRVMKEFPFPFTFAAAHLLCCVLIGWPLSRNQKVKKPIGWNEYLAVAPSAALLTFGKVLTYVSYETIPVSLAHTVKASAPIFSVIFARWWFKTTITSSVVLSLIPICIGVTLTSATEIEFKLVGFFAIAASTMTGVFRSALVKVNLTNVISNTYLMNFTTSIISFLLLIPPVLYYELESLLKLGSTADLLSIGENLGSNERPSIFLSPLLRMGVITAVVSYVQSLSGMWFLKRVNTVTHEVAMTCKRLIVIVSSIFWFGNAVTFWNCFGIFLAIFGFFLYSLQHRSAAATKAKLVVPETKAPSLLIHVNGNGVLANGKVNHLQ